METVINLEKWLRIKLDHYDKNENLIFTTNDVRKWIDLYNDLTNRGFEITEINNNENR
jgi:hypothetical protein